MRADYHVHSEFSDDSASRIEEQIERGIALGLDEICFTDHVDYGVKNDNSLIPYFWGTRPDFQIRNPAAPFCGSIEIWAERFSR